MPVHDALPDLIQLQTSSNSIRMGTEHYLRGKYVHHVKYRYKRHVPFRMWEVKLLEVTEEESWALLY